MRSFKKMILTFVLGISLIYMAGLGCSRKGNPENAAVRINSYTLTAEEFNELFLSVSAQDTSASAKEKFLDNLITRKLLVDQAHAQGLDKQKDFLHAIENFWEQSLLKIVVDRKMKEITEKSTITDEEVNNYYRKWVKENPESKKTFDEVKKTIKWQVLKESQAIMLSEWLDDLKKNANIKIDKKAIGLE